MARYAAREDEQDASGQWVEVEHGLGHVSQFAADAFGPMLAMGPVAPSRRVATAAAPDGHCTWTDPQHRQYATHPVNHHELAA